jgi:glycosyl transferase family 87
MKAVAGAGRGAAARVAAAALGGLTIASAAFAEIASFIGFSDRELLASLRAGGGPWWERPALAHLTALPFLLAATPIAVELALGSWIGAVLCLAAGAAVAPFVPPLMPYQDRLELLAPAVLTLLLAARVRYGTRGASLASWLRTARAEVRLAALAGALLVAVAFGAEFQELRRVQLGVTDFVTFHRAAAALAAGADPYAATGGAYLYPPTFAWLFVPLTALTRTGASLLWFVLKLILVGASWTLCYRGLEGGRLPPRARGALAAGIVLVALRFLMTDLQYGNTNVVVLFLMLAALRADSSERAAAAGLLLALAVSIKVIPAVLAGYFVARRRLRTLLWLAVGLLVVNAAPWLSERGRLQAHWSAYAEYGVRARLAAGNPDLDNQSLWGALARSPTLTPGATRAAWLALSALAATATLVVTARGQRETSAQQFTAAAAFFLLMLLVSPGSWVVHYTVVLLPMAAVLRSLLQRRWRPRALAALFLAANLVFTVSGLWHWSVKAADAGSLFVLVTALLLAAILWITRAEWSNARDDLRSAPAVRAEPTPVSGRDRGRTPDPSRTGIEPGSGQPSTRR